ncbi:MAG TPA: hypothetical protein VL860_00640 [Planctomycetota bacterium]|nr:hypothetical protein [Planctomycetota bacterium]
MAGKLSIHRLLKSRLFKGGMALSLGLVLAQLSARDTSDEAPFGPGGDDYRLPDPSQLFLLQEGGLKTTLKEEPLLNAIPSKTQVLVYSSDMTKLHENFLRTTLGRQLGHAELTDYLEKLTGAFEEDYTRGDGSYTDQVVAERQLTWDMMGNFYDKARREFATFVYWTDPGDSPNFVMIAAFNNSVDLAQASNVIKNYFQARRDKNSHLSVVDRTHRTRSTANAIKQLNSDQLITLKEAYCVRNNLVIYTRGPLGIEDILNRMEDPSQSVDKVDEAFKTIRAKAGTFSSEMPADLLLTAHVDPSFVARLPIGLQTNLAELVKQSEGKHIDLGAGIRFDASTGKIHEKIFVMDSTAPDANQKPVENNFLTARLLDPARTVVYATTAGTVQDWQGMFLKEQIFNDGVPKWLTSKTASDALGGEFAIAYLTRDPSNRSRQDYLRSVLILEEKDPANHAALDAWLVDVKTACGDAFRDAQGGSGAKIPVGDNAIIAQNSLASSAKDIEDLDRDGFYALLDRQPEEKGVEAGMRKADMAKRFYPAYAMVTLLDNDNKPHNYVILAYSLTVLRQIINGTHQPTNLNMDYQFHDRMVQVQRDQPEPGEVVYVNYPVALAALKDDTFGGTEADLTALALGNSAVKGVFSAFRNVYDTLLTAVEPAAFKCVRTTGGYRIDGQSISGNLAPLGLLLSYDGLHSRELEYQIHQREMHTKLQAIKTALELYRAEAGRYPTRDSLPQLVQYLITDQFTPDKQFEDRQIAEFSRVFCLLPGGKVLPDIQQVKVPSQSNLVYVEGIEDRTLGSAVVAYEAKPSGKNGSFFCLQHDGRISTMTAKSLAALLPPSDKVKNPYSQGLVDALEAANAKP